MGASRIPLFICLVTVSLSGSPGQCGSRTMVESAVEELHELNEQAVGKVGNLPADATVRLKAQVSSDEGGQTVEILEQEVIPLERGADPSAIQQKRAGSLPRDCTETDISYRGGNVVAPQGKEEHR